MKFQYYACDDYKGLVGMHFLVMRNAETNEWFTVDDYINFIEKATILVNKPEPIFIETKPNQPYQKSFFEKNLKRL